MKQYTLILAIFMCTIASTMHPFYRFENQFGQTVHIGLIGPNLAAPITAPLANGGTLNLTHNAAQTFAYITDNNGEILALSRPIHPFDNHTYQINAPNSTFLDPQGRIVTLININDVTPNINN